MNLNERLNQMEAAIHSPSFRKDMGRANEVNYWVFDYPPEQEMEVRKRIREMLQKNQKGADGYTLAVFDLYDVIIDFLVGKHYMEKCFSFEL